MSGVCTQGVLSQSYDPNLELSENALKKGNSQIMSKNKELFEHFKNYFKFKLDFLNKTIG